MDASFDLQTTCFICKKNPADRVSSYRVRLERQTKISTLDVKVETKDLIIPRCKDCQAIEKSENKENAWIAAPAMVAGIGTLLLAIYLKQPEWVIFTACFSVAIVVFAIGMVITLKRKSNESDEEKALKVRAGGIPVKEYPAVAALLADGYKIISQGG